MSTNDTQPTEQPLDQDVELVEELYNPYPATVYKQGEPNTIRLSYDVNRRDVLSLRVVMLDWGCLSTAVKLFIRHLYEYSKSNNLDLDSRNKLIDHIRDICPVAVPVAAAAGPSGLSDGKGPQSDDRPGAGPIHSGDKRKTDESTTKQGKRPTKAVS